MSRTRSRGRTLHVATLLFAFALAIGLSWFAFFAEPSVVFSRTATSSPLFERLKQELDKQAYDMKMLEMSNVATSSAWYDAFLLGTTTASTTEPRPKWPIRQPYPKYGAILPFKRVVAYYGNFYSTQMGALGEHPPETMIPRLMTEVEKWKTADPSTPVVPAMHYIVLTAQASPGKDGKYRLRMPDDQIDKALELAREVDGIVFLDFQVGLSTVQQELPIYEEYLKLPNVHVGIDPEFSMKTGAKPGTVIGSFDAADINWVAEYMAKLVLENDLPPKILMVHRFTQEMVTNAKHIQPLPEVQIVMDMDGWGDKAKKLGTYTRVVAAEPVQFTGFKLFYKNDLFAPSTGMYTPEELLRLTPKPVYIQYQ